jgi:hypothetical protein
VVLLSHGVGSGGGGGGGVNGDDASSVVVVVVEDAEPVLRAKGKWSGPASPFLIAT